MDPHLQMHTAAASYHLGIDAQELVTGRVVVAIDQVDQPRGISVRALKPNEEDTDPASIVCIP